MVYAPQQICASECADRNAMLSQGCAFNNRIIGYCAAKLFFYDQRCNDHLAVACAENVLLVRNCFYETGSYCSVGQVHSNESCMSRCFAYIVT